MTTPYEEGSKESKIAIIGEAPSYTEIRQNRPFCGPAGSLLESCLHEAGLIRRQCYLTNLFPFQVRKNREKTEIRGPDNVLLWTKTRGLTDNAAPHLAALHKRISNTKANICVPLGAVAMEATGMPTAVLKWRGSILWSEALQRKCIPSIHPSASLQGNYIWRYLIIADLRRVKEESAHPRVELPVREIRIDPTFNEVMDFLEYVNGEADIAGTDIELLNHQVSCFSVAPRKDLVMSVPLLGDGNQHRWTTDQEAQIWLAYDAICRNEKITKVGQNILFDMTVLAGRNNILFQGPVEDSMIGFNILYPDFRKGLDTICSLCTREPYYKDDGKLWSKPWKDLPKFWRYNALDSAVCLEAWEEIKQDLIEGGYWDQYRRTVDTFPAFQYIMLRGMKVNEAELKIAGDKVRKTEADKLAELMKIADYEFNPSSFKQCIEYFYVHKRIKPYIGRKTGTPTTDDTAMMRLWRRHQLKEAKLVQEIRALRKFLSSYAEVPFDKDSRLRCSYDPRGAWTGRPSSSESVFGTGTNMQNLPPEFKTFLEAD